MIKSNFATTFFFCILSLTIYIFSEGKVGAEVQDVRIELRSIYGEDFSRVFFESITQLDDVGKLNQSDSSTDVSDDRTIVIFVNVSARAEDLLQANFVAEADKLIANIAENGNNWNVIPMIIENSLGEKLVSVFYFLGSYEVNETNTNCIAHDIYGRINFSSDGDLIIRPGARIDFQSCEEIHQ